MIVPKFTLGLDLGQRRDYSALAVIEPAEIIGPRDPVTWEFKRERRVRVRHLERVRLGTRYAHVIDRLESVVRRIRAFGHCSVVVDSTGVGGAVIEWIRDRALRCELVPVLITAGDRPERRHGEWHVPKHVLIGKLKVLFERGELILPDRLPATRRLIEELTAVEARPSANGVRRYAAWSEGAHDDLVLALALAAWWSTRPPAGEINRRLL